MGNCFKTTTHDDISLLRDSDIGESSAPIVPPPPPYQVSLVNCVKFNSMGVGVIYGTAEWIMGT